MPDNELTELQLLQLQNDTEALITTINDNKLQNYSWAKPAQEEPFPTWFGTNAKQAYDQPQDLSTVNESNVFNLFEPARIHIAPLANRFRNSPLFAQLRNDPLAEKLNPYLAFLEEVNADPMALQANGFAQLMNVAGMALYNLNYELRELDYDSERFKLLQQASQMFAEYQLAANIASNDYQQREQALKDIHTRRIAALHDKHLKPILENPDAEPTAETQVYHQLIQSLKEDANTKETPAQLRKNLLSNLAQAKAQALHNPALQNLHDLPTINSMIAQATALMQNAAGQPQENPAMERTPEDLQKTAVQYITFAAKGSNLTTEQAEAFTKAFSNLMQADTAPTVDSLWEELKKPSSFSEALTLNHKALVDCSLKIWNTCTDKSVPRESLDHWLDDLNKLKTVAIAEQRLYAFDQTYRTKPPFTQSPEVQLQTQLRELGSNLQKMGKFGFNTTEFNTFRDALLSAANAAHGSFDALEQTANAYIAAKTQNGKEPTSSSGQGRLAIARSVAALISTYKHAMEKSEAANSLISQVPEPQKTTSVLLALREKPTTLQKPVAPPPPIESNAVIDEPLDIDFDRINDEDTNEAAVRLNRSMRLVHSEVLSLDDEPANIDQFQHSLIASTQQAEKALQTMSQYKQPFTTAERHEAWQHMKTIAVNCSLQAVIAHLKQSDPKQFAAEFNKAAFDELRSNIENDPNLQKLFPKKTEVTRRNAGMVNRKYFLTQLRSVGSIKPQSNQNTLNKSISINK